MAGVRRSWIKPLAAILLLAGTGSAVFAQARGSGSISGKLTDLRSEPVAGATVVVRNDATGAEMRTTTARNGAYRFSSLEAGEYTLEAMSPGRGYGRLEGIRVGAGSVAHVQAAMQFQPFPVQHAQAVFHEIPEQIPAVTTALASAPLRTLPLRARSLPVVVPVPRLLEAPAMAGSIAAEPRQALPLAATRTLESGQKPTAAAVAVSPARGAARPAQAAPGRVQTAQAAPRRVETAQAEADPASAAVTTTLSGAELQALPVSGRRWEEFLLDTPTAATPGGGAGQPSLRGAGEEGVETTVDGASTRLAFGRVGGSGAGNYGRSSVEQRNMGRAWTSGRGSVMGEAAVRAVQAIAGNVEAQGSRAAGGEMNVKTERGGTALHGQGFLFDRQNNWGARNPFTQWVKETAPATLATTPAFTPEAYTPPDHEISWGTGLGSRIRRTKLYWFGAFDGYRRNDPGLSMVKHPDMFFAQPSNDQMQALAARLGLGSANPVAEGLAAYSKMLETLDGLLGPAPRTATQSVGFGRLDWDAGERNRFTLEGTGANWNSPGGGMSRVSEMYGNHSLGSSQASEEWLLGRWEAFVTPNLLAASQFSLGRNDLSAQPEKPSGFEQTLDNNVWGQLPQIVVDSRYGFTIGNPSRFGQGSYPDEHFYRGQESVDWVRGGWLVQAGFDWSHDADATSLLRNQTGTYYYSSVENFASDALAFGAFGLSGQLNPVDPHNCDETGRVWRDSAGTLRGLGYLPCYSYYSQTMGPTNWHLSTDDWAGYATTQWEPYKLVTFSAGLRWEREQLPSPIAALANPELPLTEKLPSLGNNWGPRLSLAVGNYKHHWPLLRLGYGMYFARTMNATIEMALTQTGSAKGDLYFFMRPTDNLHAGGAPPFPYVLAGEPLSMVKPRAVEFAPNFSNPEVHQAVAAIDESLPGHLYVTASALLSLGRRLPIPMDVNIDPSVNPRTITYAVVDGTGKGPLKKKQITVPFYASWPSATSGTGTAGRLNPNYQQISEIMSRANSTYEAGMLKVSRYGRRGLGFYAHYTFAHAMDWNPNESAWVAGSGVLDPANFSLEYGTSNLDVRHSAAAAIILTAPWKMHELAGRLANDWTLSGTGQFRSGLPYTMRTTGSLPKEFTQTGDVIVGLEPGMNGSGGDNRVYGVGRNSFRYPSTWKADFRLGRRFNLGGERQFELMAETFNLFNHRNVTEIETTGYYIRSGTRSGALPTLNFLTGLKPNTTAFGQPLSINGYNFYRERQIEFGMRMRF